MRKNNLYSSLLIALATLLTVGSGCSSCSHRHHEEITGGNKAGDSIRYASLLAMDDIDCATLCRIRDPWSNARIMVQYLLVPQDSSFTDRQADSIAGLYGDYVLLRTPLTRTTLTNGCHAYLLNELGALDRVAVMCDVEYTGVDSIRSRVADGRIADGGNSASPNTEVLLTAQTDAVWISPFENSGTGNLGRLPIDLIYCADYMEVSPLARAEWMKFYGRLVGKEEEADSLFLVVEQNYLHTMAQCALTDSLIQADSTGQAHRPRLLSETITGATWFVPGGCSTLGRLYQDAGADYIWQDDTHAGSLSLSPEAVMMQAADCDVWLFKYYDPQDHMTLTKLLKQHPFYANFKAAQTGRGYACNTARSNYFDEIPFRPDLLLQSIHRILYGENVSDSLHVAPVYFEPLQP